MIDVAAILGSSTRGVIVTASDAGLCVGVNEGIRVALTEGYVSGASLLVAAPFAREAVRRLREHARGTGREKNRRLHHGDERIAQECEQYRLLAVRLIFHVSVSGFNHAYRFLFRIKENHHTHKWQSGQSPMRMLLKP